MSQVPPPMGAPPMGYQTPAPQQSQGMAVGSLVCGIISILTSFAVCLWFISAPVGIVAVVLGLIAKGKADRGEAGGKGMAKTGMILGIIGIVLSILITVGAYMGLRAAGTKAQELQQKAQQEIERIEREQQQRDDGTATPTTTEAP